jgi:F0F1-type ATP synthase epsilon subunit
MAVRQDASTGAYEQLASDAPKASATPLMHVKVHSPFKTYVNEDAYSLTAVNATGPFDILPRHHNFITLLDKCEVTIDSSTRGKVTIRISGGLMHVKADEVTVFLDV